MAALQDEVDRLQRDEHPAGQFDRDRQDAGLVVSDQGHLVPVDPGQAAKADHAAHLASQVWALLEELESAEQQAREPQASLPQAALQAVALAALRG